jgi:hypothetical protein
MVNIISVFNYILLVYIASEKLLLRNGFTERRLFTRSEIYHDDKIGCSEEFKRFYKKVLMIQYKVEYDQIYFKCDSVIDDKGKIHTKRYTEIKL